MSTSAEGFQAPNVEAEDYYQRLGAPASADADTIDSHTKKYIAEFKPELSDHENADERWDRFNKARQTLNDSNEKDLYDTFRDRFGVDLGPKAYQAWEARDRPKNPAYVDPVRDLGVAPESTDAAGSSTTDETNTTQTTTQQTSDTKPRTSETNTQTDLDTEIDTDGTYSTRSSSSTNETPAATSSAGPSSIDHVFEWLQNKSQLVVAETVTLLSMVGWILIAYLSFILIRDVAVGTAISALTSVLPIGETALQTTVTTVAVAVLGFVLLPVYFARFSGGDDWNGPFTPPGREAIEALETPRQALVGPTVVGLLALVVFSVGGGGLTTLIAGGALLSVHGRFRLIERISQLPDWADNINLVASICVLIVFVTLSVQIAPGTTLGDITVVSHPLTVIFAGIAYAISLVSPFAAVFAE